jgi:hypothetical protein
LDTTEANRVRKKYKSPLNPIDEERILELDTEPHVEEIEIKSYNSDRDVIQCEVPSGEPDGFR